MRGSGRSRPLGEGEHGKTGLEFVLEEIRSGFQEEHERDESAGGSGIPRAGKIADDPLHRNHATYNRNCDSNAVEPQSRAIAGGRLRRRLRHLPSPQGQSKN